MSKKTVDFWFEFASPYAYLSAMRIAPLAAERGVDVAYRAFLLGPVFAAQGWNDSPFNIYPAKGAYLWQDVPREAAALGLAFRKPSGFPRGSLLASRVLCAHAGSPWAPDFTRAVFHANFVDDRDISTVETVASLLSDIGQDPEAVIADSITPEAKSALRAQTDEAIELGIFGAPSFIAADALFWGNDRLERALDAAVASPPASAGQKKPS